MQVQAPPEIRAEKTAVFTSGLAIVTYIALLRILLYVIAGANYGYSRDELYYLACGEHVAWGYVDQPPLIAWLAWLLQHTIGTSLYALRLLPALAGAATIVIAGLLAREFGGKRFAMFLTSAATLVGLAFLALTHVFSMNAFDLPLWVLLAWLMARIINSGNQKLWIAVGAVLGVTLLNKYAVAFFAAGLLLGVVVSPLRRSVARPWFWAGAAIAGLIALPNFLWQMHRGYPFLQLMRNVRANGRDVALPPLAYLADQALLIGFVAALLVPLALVFFGTRRGRPFVVVGAGFVVMLAMMLVLHGKGPYCVPLYPMMFAAGATMLEQITTGKALKWGRPVFVLLLFVTGALAAPLAFPILPPETFLNYTVKLGIDQPHYENQIRGRLPQFYADMFGWEERVQMVAKYYNGLPPEERSKTVVLASNYGDAGAVDFFGPKYGLPRAIATHQNYWNWGTRGYTGESLILLGGGFGRKQYERRCESLTVVGVPDHTYARPDANQPIYHCRGLKQSLQEAWPAMRQLN